MTFAHRIIGVAASLLPLAVWDFPSADEQHPHHLHSMPRPLPQVRLIPLTGDRPTPHPTAIAHTPTDMRLTRIEEFIKATTSNPKTAKAYRQDLYRFTAWTTKGFENVTTFEMGKFREYLRTEPLTIKGKGNSKTQVPLSVSSINRCLTTLKSFYKWLHRCTYISQNPTSQIKLLPLAESQPQDLSNAQVEVIYAAIADYSRRPERDFALFAVLSHGLRAGEVSALNIGDWDGTRLWIRKAKAGKNRRVPVAPDAQVLVQGYLDWRQEQGEYLEPSTPLFLSHSNISKGDRLSYEGIRYLCGQWSELTGIEGLHAHQFRHTFATDLVLRGVPPQYGMKMTGHSSLSSFKRYISRGEEAAAEAAFFESRKRPKMGVVQEEK